MAITMLMIMIAAGLGTGTYFRRPVWTKRHSPQQNRAAVDMKFVLLQPGTFNMGFVVGDPEFEADAKLHRVTLTRPFLMGRYPVTVGQFAQFVQDTRYKTDAEKSGRAFAPSAHSFSAIRRATWRTAGGRKSPELPVTNVSWNDATAYCDWLSRVTGDSARLPTEAEWEYACRAGSTSRFYDSGPVDDLGWFGGNSGDKPFDSETLGRIGRSIYVQTILTNRCGPHPVGQKKPNRWGLHDLHGNVWEWCSDAFAAYPDSPVIDPKGSGDPNPQWRPARGGNWFDPPHIAICSNRGYFEPDRGYTHIGFRVAGDIRR